MWEIPKEWKGAAQENVIAETQGGALVPTRGFNLIYFVLIFVVGRISDLWPVTDAPKRTASVLLEDSFTLVTGYRN